MPRLTRATRVGAFVLLVAAVAACSALEGLDALGPAGAGGGGGAGDDAALGAGEAGAGDDANGDDATGDDAGPPPPPVACPGSDVTCVPAAPAGWTGPFLFYEGAAAAAPGACADPVRTTVLGSGAGSGALSGAGAATCRCTCGAPTGAACSGNGFNVGFDGMICSGSPCPTGTGSLPLNTCTLFTPGCTNSSIAVIGGASNLAVGSPGTCAGQGKTTTPTAAFAQADRACAPPSVVQSSCAAGEVCVPRPTTSLPNVCILQAGSASCPPEYPTAHAVFASLSDTRGCSPCTCDAPTGGTCVGSVSFFASGDFTCATVTRGPVASGTCNAFSNQSSVRLRVDAYVDGGSCAASATSGTPTGTVAGAAPKTVCCR